MHGRGIACYAPTVCQFSQMPPNSIPTIIRSYKSAVTKQAHELDKMRGIPIWQRNYYEHVIRNDDDLNEIREYIINNPLKWALDSENIAPPEL